MRGHVVAVMMMATGVPCLSAQDGALGSVRGLLDRGAVDSAETIVAAALRRNANDPDALFLSGRIRMARDEYEAATNQFERAIEHRPGDAGSHYWLGRAFHERQERAGMLGKPRLARRAIAAFEEAVRIDPEHDGARDWLINYLWRAPGIAGGDREEAARHLDQLARRHPITAYEIEGRLRLEDEDYRLAAQAYRQILQVDSVNIDARFMLGRIAQQTENWDAAFRWFRGAVTRDSMALGSWYQLGRTGSLSGERIGASIDAMDYYLLHGPAPEGPSLASAHWRRGTLYQRQGHLERARAEYRQALTLDPDHEEARKALEQLPAR